MAVNRRWTIRLTGDKKVVRTTFQWDSQIRYAVGAALYHEAERIMSDSKQNYVPVVTGALRASGSVGSPQISATGATVVLGYGDASTPYAAKVHENPRSGKTGGVSPSGIKYAPGTFSTVGQWKYLEEPVLKALPGMGLRIYREAMAIMAARRFGG